MSASKAGDAEHDQAVKWCGEVLGLRATVRLSKLALAQKEEDLKRPADPDDPKSYIAPLPAAKLASLKAKKEMTDNVEVLQRQVEAIVDNRKRNDLRAGRESKPTRVEDEFKSKLKDAQNALAARAAEFAEADKALNTAIEQLRKNKKDWREKVQKEFSGLSKQVSLRLPKHFAQLSADEQEIKLERVYSILKCNELRVRAERNAKQTEYDPQEFNARQAAMLQSLSGTITNQLAVRVTSQELERVQDAVKKQVMEQVAKYQKDANDRVQKLKSVRDMNPTMQNLIKMFAG